VEGISSSKLQSMGNPARWHMCITGRGQEYLGWAAREEVSDPTYALSEKHEVRMTKVVVELVPGMTAVRREIASLRHFQASLSDADARSLGSIIMALEYALGDLLKGKR